MNKVLEFIGTCVAKSTHIFDYIEKKTGVDVLERWLKVEGVKKRKKKSIP